MILSLLAAAALLAPQSAPGELPFFSQGTALIGQADELRDAPLNSRGDYRLLERLQSAHHIVRVGVMEIWVPLLEVTKDGELRPGPELSEVRPYAAQLLGLQRLWLEHTGLRGAELARHEAALDAISRWSRQLKGRELPELDTATRRATRMLESWFGVEVPRAGIEAPERKFELVMILCPTRAHYFAVLGAAGLILDSRRDTYWHPAARRSVNQWLTHECIAVAMAIGPTSDRDPALANNPMDPGELAQQMSHTASHLLSNRFIFDAPSWFREGVAIQDTVTLNKDDDTLCSGYSESRSASYAIPALAQLLPFLERDLSPYRDGPAQHFFVKLLRPDKHGAFSIHDLDLGKRAFTLPGPFLGEDARIPDVVFDASEGIQRGFAEFMRAYAAAFTDFLSQQLLADRSVLAWTIEFMRQRRSMLGSEELLPTALRMITQKTLGESLDPELDLEGAFQVWLGTRK